MAINTKQILADMKINQGKLASCLKHDFRRMEDKLFAKYICAHCTGTVDGSAAMWYARGLVDGKK